MHGAGGLIWDLSDSGVSAGRAVSDLLAMTSDWKPAAAEADRLTGMFAVVAPLPLLKAAILFLKRILWSSNSGFTPCSRSSDSNTFRPEELFAFFKETMRSRSSPGLACSACFVTAIAGLERR